MNFSAHQILLDSLEGSKNEIIELYREHKKLLAHTIFKEDGDCSSIHIQLGTYKVKADKIIFYTYWAATDRMPNSVLTYGFRKQEYTIDNTGKLVLTKSKIYLEDVVFTENKNLLADNGWEHKGMKFLNQAAANRNEEKLLEDYILKIEKEYNGDFVLGKEKEDLEKEVRTILAKEINRYTKDWKEGEEYGKVKK